MDGTILVSKGHGFATSTFDFDYLGERIRAELRSKHPLVAKAVYEPLDEGGMTFLSLEGLDGESFRFFLEATNQAEAKASTDASYAERSTLWRQLSDVLWKDARLVDSRCIVICFVRSTSGRFRPAAPAAGFPTWQPAMLDRTGGFGQKQPLLNKQISGKDGN